MIDWIDDKIEEHIQTYREFDIDYFKNYKMMIIFFESIYFDFDY